MYMYILGFPGGASGRETACSCRRPKRRGFNLWVGKIPWRRQWLPTPVFLPGEPHRQRSLVGYSPWGQKESDMTDVDLACIHVYIRKYSPFSKEIILDESSQ